MIGDEVTVDLTFAIPMYNEAENAREVVRRALDAGERSGWTYEVLAVDDGSSDDTPAILAELRATEPNFRWVQLRPNCGQPAASQAGLLAAHGRMVAVLDADLQTPPEVVLELAAALEAADPDVVAVFGVTSTATRDDPLRLLVGQAVFYFLETRFGAREIPHGASSFFVMRRDAAQRVARLPFRSGNVGAVIAAMGLRATTRSYVKPKSGRADSRLGLSGHVREALGSLALVGVLTRFAGAGAAVAATAAVVTRRRSLVGVAAAFGAAGVACERFVARSLDPSRAAPLPVHEGEAAAGS